MTFEICQAPPHACSTVDWHYATVRGSKTDEQDTADTQQLDMHGKGTESRRRRARGGPRFCAFLSKRSGISGDGGPRLAD
jgi:hypothetical protein